MPTPQDPERVLVPHGGQGPKAFYDCIYPPDLRAAEVACLKLRREKARTEGYAPLDPDLPDRDGDPAPVQMPSDAVGLALSGGGIRSATFCLGVLQTLASQGLLRRVDFLSTVSGGGYIGAFVGALTQRATPIEPNGRVGIDRTEADLANMSSAPLRWLREHGRYMSPNGSGDEITAGAVYLRNLCAIHVVMTTTMVALFGGVALLRAVIDKHWPGVLPVWHTGPIAWSPTLALALAIVALVAFPLGWGYWFIQRDKNRQLSDWMAATTPFLVLAVSAGAAAWTWRGQSRGVGTWGALFFTVAAILALLSWRTVGFLAKRQEVADIDVFARAKLSQWLSLSLIATAVVLMFAVIDSAGEVLSVWIRADQSLWPMKGGGLAATLGALVAGTSRLWPLLGKPSDTKHLSLPKSAVAGIAALIVVGGILVGIATLTHVLAQKDVFDAACLTVGAIVLSMLFGLTLRFVNSSSHQALYANRLTRAYLGASNPRRYTTATGQRLSDPIPGDNIGWGPYAPFVAGGPLHVVNITLNETVSGASQIEQRDRKGLPLAVGPCGLSGGGTSHALWRQSGDKDQEHPDTTWRGRLPGSSSDWVKPIPAADGPFHMFAGAALKPHAVEALTVGAWTAISGAAFSTGLGARTSLALSMLLGVANVRLGYWWDSEVRPSDRDGVRTEPTRVNRLAERVNGLFPVQTHLFQELSARFFGPHRRRWYLTDGGHFENTGCYELLRRRVPFIIACDNGQDGSYSFEDLGNLVRKARIDFRAEIVFLSRSDIETRVDPVLHRVIGVLDDFRTTLDDRATGLGRQFAKAHALMADVFYEGAATPGSVILFLKPSLMGEETLDVLQYREQHPAFPQEPTSDQFFDEAQWESYRALGEHIASKVFRPLRTADGWLPASMRNPGAR